LSRRGCARHNARRDANEPDIVQALEAQGFTVDRINGKGLPDLLVSKAGRQWLCEVKMPKGTFKQSQKDWREKWRGPAPVTLRSVDDACRFALLAMEGGGQ
jgi:Holliday junction resolvase